MMLVLKLEVAMVINPNKKMYMKLVLWTTTASI